MATGVRVLHGWAGGDGDAAANALIETFGDEHPDAEANFRAAERARMRPSSVGR